MARKSKSKARRGSHPQAGQSAPPHAAPAATAGRGLGGRPRRLDVARYPSGKIKPAAAREESGPSLRALARRLMAGGAEDLLSQEHGSLFGQWRLQGWLADNEYDTGLRLAGLVARYEALLAGPRPPAAAEIEGLRGKSLTPDDAAHYQQVMAEMAEVKRQLLALDPSGRHLGAVLDAAKNRLRRGAGPLVRASLKRLSDGWVLVRRRGQQAAEKYREAA